MNVQELLEFFRTLTDEEKERFLREINIQFPDIYKWGEMSDIQRKVFRRNR